MVSAYLGCCNKPPWTGSRTDNRNLFLTLLEARSSASGHEKARVYGGSCFLIEKTSSLGPHMVKEADVLCGASFTRGGPKFMHPSPSAMLLVPRTLDSPSQLAWEHSEAVWGSHQASFPARRPHCKMCTTPEQECIQGKLPSEHKDWTCMLSGLCSSSQPVTRARTEAEEIFSRQPAVGSQSTDHRDICWLN